MKKNLVILSGAGMSAESGISTFRDAGGLWDKYPVMQVASAEGYVRDPELVIDFYNERRKQLLDVEPNAGHTGHTAPPRSPVPAPWQPQLHGLPYQARR